MNRIKDILFITILVCCCLTITSYAQTWGKIVGYVKDGQTGTMLPGANVLIQGSTIGAATDVNGYYTILHVSPGVYTVVTSYLGYQKVLMKNVEVLTDLTTTVNFNLQPKTLLGEEVVIIAEKPLVRKDLTSSEARIQADEIEKMPVRDIGDILDMQAGVVRDANNNVHIRGGRSSEVAYMVNGINITDDYYRSQALTLENESIQELQVISGTFNAEYGNAMSGVINIVTKTGGDRMAGKIEAWMGDYLSNRSDLFWNIDDLNPLAEYNFQGTLSGPVVSNKINYFVTGRKTKNEGWLYGPNAYQPQGRSQIINGETVIVYGDSSPVAINPMERLSGQGVLEWKILPPLTLKIDILASSYERSWYTHEYRLNPRGQRNSSGYGTALIAKIRHILNKRTFYETIFSYKKNAEKSRLYDNPYDSRYVHPDSLTAGSFQFYKAGTDLFRSYRATRSLIGKFDFTSQINCRHQFKTGVEIKKDGVDFENLTLVPAKDENGLQIEPFQPYIEDIYSTNHILFTRKPESFAIYAQDKIEYEDVIINIGLRYDYFNSNGRIPADSKDPNIYNPQKLKHIYKDLNNSGVIEIDEQVKENKYSLEERSAFWYQKASPKFQLSPRFGIAYPITDKGVIHFSYGIFYQIPEYSQLYENDEMKMTEGQGIWGPFSNPDLNPQRTTMYELGLKQQIMDNVRIDVTGYYRDIRDWVSTSAQIPTYVTGVSYTKKINRDYANVKGVTFSMTRRLANHFAFDLDYTYQIVQGTNSSPEDEYDALNSGAEPKKQLAPLDWDQRNSLNFNLLVGDADLGCNLITRYYSGQPYTPEITAGTLVGQNVIAGLATNLRRKPNRFTVDVNLFKTILLGKFRCGFFLRVYNLFDAKNPTTVFEDSGRPDHTIYQQQENEADPSWFIRPDFYAEPRSLQLGLKLSFLQ
ncbi:MAG: TonB-dependent receptor [Candidatus Marinimicrobia bacterium]|nr:TonB-dependent receptor [Candidatus Neomarinimicrobiota bacterium]